MTSRPKPLVLLILDGFGLLKECDNNAIAHCGIAVSGWWALARNVVHDYTVAMEMPGRYLIG